MVPSYRVPRDSGSGAIARMLLVAGGLLGAVALGGAVVWGFGRVSGPRTVPVIEPDSRPIKVRPENPGGLVVPNTDQLVLEPLAVRRAAEARQGANAQLAPQPEAPQLDLLRREAAPPAPAPVPMPELERSVDPPLGAAPARTAPAPAPAPIAEAPAAAPQAAPAASAPQASTPAAPLAAGRRQVQLGALASEEAAKAEWTRLQRRVPALADRQPAITRLDRGADKAPLYRLRTGGLADSAAQQLCDAVKGAGGACMVVPGRG